MFFFLKRTLLTKLIFKSTSSTINAYFHVFSTEIDFKNKTISKVSEIFSQVSNKGFSKIFKIRQKSSVNAFEISLRSPGVDLQFFSH